MDRFSNTTREVAQNGRRGALMISIDINHPDVMEFIKIKRDLTKITGANISIKVNDEFMRAVENDEDYILRFPCDADISTLWNLSPFEYNETVRYSDTTYFKKIKAKEYWNEIIKSAHNVAEPGILFWDNTLNNGLDAVYLQYKPKGVNPCGEITLSESDSCRLIAINLYSFVNNPFTEKSSFDFDKFYEVVYEAMRLSDDLVDLEIEAVDKIISKIKSDNESEDIKLTELKLWEKIREVGKNGRRTGLGITALADMLASLGLKYDSDEALSFVDKVMKKKLEAELDCSIDLAILRGKFEGCRNGVEETKGNNFYTFLYNSFPEQYERMRKYGRRNVSFSTVAPTGTVSLLAQVTSGIEPLFQPFYIRRKKINSDDEGVRVDFVDDNGDSWQEFPVLHPKFKDWVNKNFDRLGLSGQQDIEDEMSKKGLQLAFEQSPWYKSTANDIDWSKRVKMQSVIQKYITHSISSTINLPKNVSEEAVSDIYLESWKKGLKGITVYRDGSRSGVLITDNQSNNSGFNYKDAVKRPKELDAETHYTTTKGVSYHVIVGLLDGKPYEVFIDDSENRYSPKGKLYKKARGKYLFKNGGDDIEVKDFMSPEQKAITRLTSSNLRHGTDVKFIVEQLQKIDGDMFDFTKSLARVLKKYIPDGVKSTITCNECGSSNVIFEEGCYKCLDCASSKCG